MSRSESSDHCVWLRECNQETADEIKGHIQGSLPKWLEGRVTRNGPGKLRVGDTQYHHLFDSLAMLHQFNIFSGEVTYRSRFLNSDTYKKNMEANRIIVTEFGTVAYPDPCMTLYQRFKNMFTLPLSEDSISDNCLVNVCQVKDEMFAITETAHIRRVDPQSLKTIGEKVCLTNYIAVNLATAHPHIEPNGNVYNMGSSFMNYTGPYYNVVEIPMGKIEEAKVVASVPPLRWLSPSYFHSFAITDNYWVFIEQPLVFSLSKLMLGILVNSPPIDALTWLPMEKAVFRVINRSTAQLVSTHYTSDAFVTFHHTNAWEENGQLILDLCGTEDGDIVKMLFISNLEKKTTDDTRLLYGANMRRYILPLVGVNEMPIGENLVKRKDSTCTAIKQTDKYIHCTHQVLHPDFFDMPRINYKRNGKSYRYAYGVSTKGNDLVFERLVKLDVKTGQLLAFTENNFTVAEPIFVPSPKNTDEDDGVILSTLLKKTDPLYVALLVLNAKDMKEMARVEFRARGNVTSSFHGQYVGVGEDIHTY